METIEIKNIYGDVIFKHTAENNTVKLTVETAVKNNIPLKDANLKDANLKGATLESADLEGADLESADISWANLAWANLADANLTGADISWTDLADTILKDANLKDANLKGAVLEGADLNASDITEANLNWAILNGAKNIPYIPLACPSEGAFVAWKKVDGYFLVKLQIPEDARRSSATSRKCRCDKAMVLDITSLDGGEHYDEVTNNNYNETIYKVGEMVYPDLFDENRWNECSHGIYFFVNKEDAINY